MAQFEEPEVLAAFDRSFGDKGEELRLERGEYQGKPTFTLRVYWKTPDGAWRWSAQQPTQSGKCWKFMSLKGRELQKLGEALIAASRGEAAPANDNRRPASPQRRRAANDVPREIDDDDIPF